MGNNTAFKDIKEPELVDKKNLTVATLNYCGIAFSPFEFYFKEFEKDLKEISIIFKRLIPSYVPKFEQKGFKWKMGKIEKAFKKGRFSHMFHLEVGIFWKSFLTRQEFQQKWDAQFKKNVGSFNFEWEFQEKQTVKLYDFIMYHTLLAFVFQNDSFDDAIKNNPDDFIQRLRPLYEISFLDEEKKLKKFMSGFIQLNPDVFFIQEYSNVLITELEKNYKFHITIDPKEDSLVLLNKASFAKFYEFNDIIKEINSEQKKNLRWAESIAFVGADNYIFACVHLSSKEEKNSSQIANLKEDLLRLKAYLPKYEIIVGGDLNSFLEPEPAFSEKFHLYPRFKWDFTTLKKRTYSQSQYNKAEKEVKQSKDRIISTLNIEYGEVRFLTGTKADDQSYLPTDEHPHDHFICLTKITAK